VHVTAEMAPLAKVGGLGDVVSGLSKACIARGHAVEVLLPFYECIAEGAVADLTLAMEFDSPTGRVRDGVMHHGALRTLVYTGEVRR
jgi:starch synthase